MQSLKKEYKHILFDLDRTLWDFETNSRTTLEHLYKNHLLENNIDVDDFIKAYHKYNNRLWAEYTAGNIKKDKLRQMRFFLTLKQFKVNNYDLAARLDLDYVRICPTQTALFPHTLELLDFLHARGYPMYILTNGFLETQQVKLHAAGIDGYFKRMYDSETIGHAKPSIGIFQYVLDDLQAQASECIMIGDDWKADIQGAAKMDIDQVFFNPHQIKVDGKATYEITSLKEVEQILK